MSNSVDFTKIVAFDDEPDILNDAANRITYFDFSAVVLCFSVKYFAALEGIGIVSIHR